MLTRIICFAHCEDVEIRPAEKNVLIMSNKKIKTKSWNKKTNKQTNNHINKNFLKGMYGASL